MAHYPSQWHKKAEPVVEEPVEEPPSQPNLTKAELKSYLDAAGVEYSSSATKAQLQGLVEEINGGA